MSLPAPNLDDRTFQQIVDDVKRQIGLRCPEWTDHNVSDPGVTLIELFAWMTEMTLFRLNQVPERNYIRFLEMLGVTLETPRPAQTELLFRLSRPIGDTDGEESYECTLREGDTVAATVRTETEEAIEFTTDARLQLVRPRLAAVKAVVLEEGVGEDEALTAAKGLHRAADGFEPPAAGRRSASTGPGEAKPVGFAVFGDTPPPRQNSAVYLGFEADVSGNVVAIDAECIAAAATGLDPRYPAQVWEVWDGSEAIWSRLSLLSDTTSGFDQTGAVELVMPLNLVSRVLGGSRAYWVRCRYTTDPEDVPPRATHPHGPPGYSASPLVTRLSARVVGGMAPASNSTTVTMEEIGQSAGTPGQVFRLRNASIQDRGKEETILIGERGAPPAELQQWEEKPDFSESGPSDLHFTCDSLTGRIAFGPSIPQPDGTARQYGAIPPKDLTIYFSSYRYGGGTHGNVRENQVRVLKSSIPYIAEVTNPSPARGGQDLEHIERAKMRGRAMLKTRERAVTGEDFEELARRASSGVGRARCVQPPPLHVRGDFGENIPPGVVRVLIVPALSRQLLVPRPTDLRVPQATVEKVQEYLDERRLLTTVLDVGEPHYVFISTEITLVADPHADADQVQQRVRERLATYIHPLTGGPNGDGWPFKRALTLADVYAQVGAVGGVAFLLDAKVFYSTVVDPARGLLGAEEPLDLERGRIEVFYDQEKTRAVPADLLMLGTREHRIRCVPMSQVGTV